jgi:hypothetical protein
MISLSKLLDFYKIPHYYFLTYSYDYSSHPNFADLKSLPWINFGQGMEEWILSNTTNRGKEIQPSTQSQLDWLLHNCLPHLDYDQKRLYAIIDEINSTKFIPYNSDREEIWESIKNKYDYNL